MAGAQPEFKATPPAPYRPLTTLAAAALVPAVAEDRVRRIAAYLIDLVPIILLAVLHLLPIFGWMLYGLLHACYWLFRDINGASPGKLILGSYVASTGGSTSTTNQRLLRNLPLAIPGILGIIPIIGVVLELVAALIIFGTEAVMLLVTGRRIGDLIANTTVLRKLLPE